MMHFDFAAHVGAVTRTVSTLERDGKPVRAVKLERRYDTTAEDLWDAVTNPERLPRWFLPISGELEPGGKYQLEGNASGTISDCDPPRYVAATWEFGDNLSWVDDHWQQYGPGATGVGWDLGLLGLAVHLSGTGTDRFDEELLTGTAEGKAFIAGCSDDWRRADIVAGEDPAHAEAAARLTAAFYMGEPPKVG